ncbi:DUF5671 domain-containing protein [Luteibacter sp. dw_328]|uniref:DUF5671 domain-containing protein n=1 Tax=Luteibacter sp. dw_328 TaxID=2719796 RepID=UPI001BD60879|nr:DUF5671 domain-containing protein [Luteibacter sp. dw_328]
MASGTQDLERFVRKALEKGSSKEQVQSALIAAGWTVEQVRSALSGFADVPFVLPVPRPRPYLSAREAFLYLVLFTTLYVSAYHLGSLLFDLIDRAFPDPASFTDSSSNGIRWSIASIIVAFPVFIGMSMKVGAELTRHPEKRLSGVRRWLTYLTLFVAAVVLLCDLITLVDHGLGGELSVRFLLKVVVAAIIAVAVFGYYLWDLRRDEREA